MNKDKKSLKYLMVIKLLLVFVLSTIFQVNAATYGQNVTLNIKNASLKEVLDVLRKQTGYHFLYRTEMLNQTRQMSINVTNEPLTKVLLRRSAIYLFHQRENDHFT
jgi:hypothetical protein